MRVLRALLVALAAVGAAGGCGGSDDDRDAPAEGEPPAVSGEHRAILSTIDTLHRASRQGDVRKICNEIFTDSFAESIGDASTRSCEKEVRETLASPDAQLSVGRQMVVRESRARVTVRDQDGRTLSLALVKAGDRWRIEGIEPVKR